MALKLGQKVAWWSSSNGSRTKKKVGVIVTVVAPKTAPPADIKRAGLPRDHESYVVEVFKDPIKQTGRRYYWPRVSVLVKV